MSLSTADKHLALWLVGIMNDHSKPPHEFLALWATDETNDLLIESLARKVATKRWQHVFNVAQLLAAHREGKVFK